MKRKKRMEFGKNIHVILDYNIAYFIDHIDKFIKIIELKLNDENIL